MQVYSINRSLNGSTVLVTGVTGFVGGALLERILRLSPGPERVFVLVRKRQGLEPRDRVDTMLTSPLFSGLDLRALEKVYVVPGDITVDGLGLSDHNRALLLSTCTHVFHSAAAISFAIQLESAVRVNVLGTRYVLRLAKKMTNIKSMVHVSTAFANCTMSHKEFLEERIYPTRIDPRTFADMIESMSSHEMKRRSKEFLGDHPNTYTFTKQMAENLLVAERGQLPLSIIRPGIILNSWEQPMKGWVDKVDAGVCGLMAGLGKGVFRTIQADPKARVDIIPVDMVVSAILASSICAMRNPEKVHVFHCTSSTSNSTNWSQYCDQIVKASRSNPCEDVVWYPGIQLRRNRLRNTIALHAFHILPAHILNILWQFKRPGQTHLLLNIQRRYAKGCNYTSFFSTRQWTFSRQNASALFSALSTNERNAHPMDPEVIDWDRYFENCILGIRQYFHKEPATTTDRAIRQMKRLKLLAYVTPFLASIVFWYFMTFLLPGSPPAIVTAPLAGFVLLFFMWV